jgi:hypothetical protein
MKAKIWILIVLAVIFVIIAALSLGRQSTSSTGLLDRDTFVELYVDLEMAAEKSGIGTPEYEAVRDSILAAHETDFEQVTAMLKSYDARPEEWAEVWDMILAELEQRRAILRQADSATAN